MTRLFPSLTLRLGLMAAALGLVALLAAALAVGGMAAMTRHTQALEAAERRLDRYAVLSTQAGRYLVVATEAVQSGLGPEARRIRLETLAAQLATTLAQIRADLEAAVAEAAALGLDEQSRRATIGLALARIEAQFQVTHAAVLAPGSPEALKGYIDIFSIGVDPNLNAAITDEIRGREAIRTAIARLSQRLTAYGLALGGGAVALAGVAVFGLIRPQMRRLDRLTAAARRIAGQDFAVALPEGPDEIGRAFAEMNRMARALALRQSGVASEWARLNDTIASRTADLEAANARLDARDRDRRRFFADISHELRTPLTVISMEAQLGLTAEDAETREAFATIRARAERLGRRIDDLLRLARSETGLLELDPVPLDLADTVLEAVAETAAEARAAEVTLETGGLQPARVTADANWTRQVVVASIRNALTHAAAGGRIALGLTLNAGRAEITVTDNGQGIPDEVRDRVFDRFARGGASDGFGLGLALVRWVMEAQGGALALDSPAPPALRLGPAPGTTLCLSLPVAPTAPRPVLDPADDQAADPDRRG